MTSMSAASLDQELQHRVTAFYAYETMLLDDFLFDEWVALFTDDSRYVMPFLESTQNSSRPSSSLPAFHLFNDDKESMLMRVARLNTGLAPGETPRTVTQRFVTDILVTAVAGPEVSVRSSVLVLSVRHERHESSFAGRRKDVLRADGNTFQIARREITLMHSVLPRTISIFF